LTIYPLDPLGNKSPLINIPTLPLLPINNTKFMSGLKEKWTDVNMNEPMDV